MIHEKYKDTKVLGNYIPNCGTGIE